MGDQVQVLISGNASGGGKYTGKILDVPTADVSASGDVVAADFGAAPSSDNALIINSREDGLTATHYLTDAKNGSQLVWGGEIIQIQSDGTFVVAIDGFWFGSC